LGELGRALCLLSLIAATLGLDGAQAEDFPSKPILRLKLGTHTAPVRRADIDRAEPYLEAGKEIWNAYQEARADPSQRHPGPTGQPQVEGLLRDQRIMVLMAGSSAAENEQASGNLRRTALREAPAQPNPRRNPTTSVCME
jgi:hypothetical protein